MNGAPKIGGFRSPRIEETLGAITTCSLGLGNLSRRWYLLSAIETSPSRWQATLPMQASTAIPITQRAAKAAPPRLVVFYLS
jgi:hypothetical protein